MSGIDYIGTSRIALRQTGDRDAPTVTIRRLSNDESLELDGDEFADLTGLILASVAGDRYLHDAQ